MTDALLRIRAALAASAAESSDYDLNPALRQPGLQLRPAAVLVALARGENGPDVILTRRSAALRHHPGQIAFPGGKLDPEDTSPEAAALREAREEIGLPPQIVDIIGKMPVHETVTGYSVTPVLAQISADFTPIPEAGEVDEVFRVPFAYLADRRNYRVEQRRWQGVLRGYYVVPWGPYYIWGATARMLYALADRLQK